MFISKINSKKHRPYQSYSINSRIRYQTIKNNKTSKTNNNNNNHNNSSSNSANSNFPNLA